MRRLVRSLVIAGCTLVGAVVATGPAAHAATAPTGATVTGVVTGPDGRPLYGMQVQAQPTAPGCPAGVLCGPQATSGPSGAYTLTGLPAGGYAINVVDGSTSIHEATLALGTGTAAHVDIRLPAPAVPSKTASRHAARDLAWLNAERAKDGVPAGLALNTRWATECAAHDGYERLNHVLEHPEDPTAPGASAGGGWAGLNGLLAQSRWTARADPWENAPIHLLQLLAPSLTVVGIDDGGGLQCATTWPGMLRAPGVADAVHTYPAAEARGVPASELARESPFVPGQFVGIPAGRTTGRELFVYLNRAGQTGQAQVKIVRASLTRAGGRASSVSVRWVDNATRTLGPYLAGGIVIPVSPLHGNTTYRATVVVQDGSRTLTRAWSFTTG
jgi:hypothetical protein